MFSRKRKEAPSVPGTRAGFEYLSDSETYLDSACQTLRPQSVIDAVNDYYLNFNACGERVKYAWGKKVDELVDETRSQVLKTFDLRASKYEVSFTLNTTFALNLLLQQLPLGRYSRVLTTQTEHNSVFLSTISFANKAGVERVLLERDDTGAVVVDDAQLKDALVVVSAMNNFDGTVTASLSELVARVQRHGGTIIIDAAQAAPHALAVIKGLNADAICFSAHKIYGPSLGVAIVKKELLASLEISFIGGGQVAAVSADSYELDPALHTRLEPGLQAWGEIIGLGAALKWLESYKKQTGLDLHERELALSTQLFDGLASLPNLELINTQATPVISMIPTRTDSHQLATFLSKAEIMARSGYFCVHHYLLGEKQYRPLLRFSIGAHNNDSDIARTLEVMSNLMKGL